MNSFKDLFLLILTVALFYLAFPSGGYGYFAWLALVPIMVALNKQTGRPAFLLALLAATLGWMVSIWWVVEGLAKITHSQYNIVIPFVFLFCVFSALPYGIAAWFHCRYKWGTSFSGTIKSTLIITSLVNFIPHLLPGNLAHALYLYPEQIQLAAIGGVALVFFVIHWVNFLLAAAVVSFRTNASKSRQFLLLAVVIWSVNWGYGSITMAQLSQQLNVKNDASLTVAMVQPNFPTRWRTRADWQKHHQQLIDLLKKVANTAQIDLIVLPEIPMPISYKKYSFDQLLFERARNNQATLITSIDFAGDQLSEQHDYYNSIELVQNSEQIQQYHKQVLLPFGEYLPFEQQLPFLRTLFPFAPRYQAGQQLSLLSLKTGNKTIKLVPLICYEAVFTGLVGQSVNQGGQLLVNTVDDAWFGATAGRKVHFALALFRAVEYRIPLIRVTNNGDSAIVDVRGKIIPASIIAPFKSGFSITQVVRLSNKSIYQQSPYLFMIICLVFSGYILLSCLRSTVKRNAHGKD